MTEDDVRRIVREELDRMIETKLSGQEVYNAMVAQARRRQARNGGRGNDPTY